MAFSCGAALTSISRPLLASMEADDLAMIAVITSHVIEPVRQIGLPRAILATPE